MQVQLQMGLGSPIGQRGVRYTLATDRNRGCVSLPHSKEQTYNSRATHGTESGRAR